MCRSAWTPRPWSSRASSCCNKRTPPCERGHDELATDQASRVDHLKSRYRDQLKAAFQSALTALSARDRNLLRIHFVERLTIDELGVMHHVHRATVARWIAALRMPPAERRQRLRAMAEAAAEMDVERWAENMLTAIRTPDGRASGRNTITVPIERSSQSRR